LGLVLDEPEANDVAVPTEGVKIFAPVELAGLAEMSMVDYSPYDGLSIEFAERACC
jgi:hypothetical protein